MGLGFHFGLDRLFALLGLRACRMLRRINLAAVIFFPIIIDNQPAVWF